VKKMRELLQTEIVSVTAGDDFPRCEITMPSLPVKTSYVEADGRVYDIWSFDDLGEYQYLANEESVKF
jgi:hypothetical protein